MLDLSFAFYESACHILNRVVLQFRYAADKYDRTGTRAGDIAKPAELNRINLPSIIYFVVLLFVVLYIVSEILPHRCRCRI